jgi:hypothetical protein
MPTDETIEADIVRQASRLIVEGQDAASRHANYALTLTYWKVGGLVGDVIIGAGRADYGQQIVAAVGRQLSWTHFRLVLPLKDPAAEISTFRRHMNAD